MLAMLRVRTGVAALQQPAKGPSMPKVGEESAPEVPSASREWPVRREPEPQGMRKGSAQCRQPGICLKPLLRTGAHLPTTSRETVSFASSPPRQRGFFDRTQRGEEPARRNVFWAASFEVGGQIRKAAETLDSGPKKGLEMARFDAVFGRFSRCFRPFGAHKRVSLGDPG